MNRLLLSVLFISFIACAQKDKDITSSDIKYEYEVVAGDMYIPWGFDFFPDGSLIVTEKEGELFHVKDNVKTEITGFPQVKEKGQGGLMDVKIHPDYPEQPWIYASFANEDPNDDDKANTRLVRFQLNESQVTNLEVLYQAENYSDKGQHFGSRIEFDNEGYVYFSVGDRGYRDLNPQDITRDNGKIYRLNADGSIPSDNPFVNEADAKKAIYSYGHRNPQGMEMHPESGKIWVHEHGPRGGDEINIIDKAVNYGWPVISYGINYSGTTFTDITEKEGMAQPFHYWVPSIAPSGMAFVRSDKYPHLNGNLLVGSLKFMYVEHLIIENDKVVKREKILEGEGRIRSIEQGPDGFIYVGVEGIGVVKLIEG
jgi:quinoprotein glucose dehydrogenase